MAWAPSGNLVLVLPDRAGHGKGGHAAVIGGPAA